MIVSFLLTLISAAYFIGMLAINDCRDNFLPYDAIFTALIGWTFLLIGIYFTKMLFCGDCCCTCLVVLNTVLCVAGVIILIIVNKGIFSAYGVGFDDVCQSLTTLYIFGSLACVVIVAILAFIFAYSTCCKKEERTVVYV